jgi:hypothetical protein
VRVYAQEAGEFESLSAQEMAARVDEFLAARWKEANVSPSAPASDEEFVRRVFLDLTGVTPKVSQSRKFFAEEMPDRARLIDDLLASPGHATHLANLWRSIMLPGGLELEQFNNIVGVQNWLRGQFAQNMRYDRMVSDLLVATSAGEAGPALFFTALDLAPEKLASTTARIFLGLQIECAQCHDHPFDRWTQKDFWGYAAFFARLRQSNPGPVMTVSLIDASDGEVKLPESEEIVPPQYPSGPLAQDSDGGTRRVQLAIWIASRENPFLARAAVNRVWAQLFGRGLVEPVDDLGPNNPPSHPELLEALTSYFIATGYDLRNLYRTLANTKAYQLSSSSPVAEGGEPGDEPPPELFAKMSVKPLSAEQLYDSLHRILLRSGEGEMNQGPFANRLFSPGRLSFLARMEASQRSATEYHAGVPQALTLMNGGEISEATSAARSGILGALETPLFSDNERLEVLFLACLSRRPTKSESDLCLEYLGAAGAEGKTEALGDVLWAVLNSAEFALNH